MHQILAQVITVCFTMPLNFILNKIWTYRSKES
jgi:putative flippase GtrA